MFPQETERAWHIEGVKHMDDFGLFGAIKGLLIISAVIGIPLVIVLIAFQYWYLSIPLVALAIGGVVYWKRQKRASNMV